MLFASSVLAQGETGATPWLPPTDPAYDPANPSSNPEILGTSLLFNIPNGAWDHGEGFLHNAAVPNPPADTGGYHAGLFDDGSQLQASDVHIQSSATAPNDWNDWTVAPLVSFGAPSVKRLVGYLHPSPVAGVTDGFTAETAFEVFAPDSLTPSTPSSRVVLVIAGNPAGGISRQPATSWQDHINAGLSGNYTGTALPGSAVERPLNLPRLVSASGTAQSGGIQIVAAHIHPPIGGGELHLSTQRILQLERAVRYLLAPGGSQFPATWTGTPQIDAVLVIGGSNGGHVAQMLALHFPDRIHGAVSFQFSSSMRATANSQEMALFITALQGFDDATFANSPGHTLSYSAFFNSRGFNYGTGNLLTLWKAGQLRRPVFLIASDEDTVGTGEEDLSFIAGTDQYQPNGATGPSSPSPGRIFWAVNDRACHYPYPPLELPADVMANALGGGVSPLSSTQYDQELIPLPFLDEVVASAQAVVLTPMDRPQAPSTLPPQSIGSQINSELDPYDHFLTRESTVERRIALASHPAGSASLVEEDLAFLANQRGHGTWTGMSNSLAVDGQGRIYVGSADGVVSRLRRNPMYPAGAPAPLELDQRVCPVGAPLSGPFSHGYGTCGLDVDNEFLVFGTHRRIYAYDVSQGSAITPRWLAPLTWEQQRPRKMQIVDGFFAGVPGKHVIYLTFFGELVVRELSAGLPIVAQISNPGLMDFEVAPLNPDTGRSRPVFVTGVSGHVLRIVMSKALPTPAWITAASEAGPIASNLVWSVSGPFGSGLVALRQGEGELVKFGPTPILATQNTITLPGAVVGVPGVVPGVDFSGNVVSLFGLELFAVLSRGSLYLVPSDQAAAVFGLTPFAYNTLRFPAINYPIAIAGGDVDGDGLDDLAIATQNGQVAYITAPQLLDPMSFKQLADATLGAEWFGVGPPSVPNAQSTGSAVATWGMAWTLDQPGGTIEVIDQSGRRWRINSNTGALTYDHTAQVEGSVVVPVVPMPKPIRDLAFVGLSPPLGTFPPTGQTDYSGADVGSLPLPSLANRRYRLLTSLDYSVTAPDAEVPVFVSSVDRVIFDEGYLLMGHAGDSILGSNGVSRHAAYWGNIPKNAVLGIKWSPTFAVYRSSTNQGGGVGSVQMHLRNGVPQSTTPHCTQTLRLGEWIDSGTTHVRAIVASMGGSIAGLDLAQSPAGAGLPWTNPDAYPTPTTGDHGFGGLALCVAEVLPGTGRPTIFFAPLADHGGGYAGAPRGFDMVSSLRIYDYDIGGSALNLTETFVFDDAGGTLARPKLFGICGIAVGNLVDEPSDGVVAELVLTTLNGDLVIYNLTASTGADPLLGQLLHWGVYDGSLGVNNSILIDETSVPRAIFVAGSMGTRKFKVQP